MASDTRYFNKLSSILGKESFCYRQSQDMLVSIALLWCNSHTLCVFVTDGQSIATRLAKQISSTIDCLKRAVARYNSHPADECEGKLYQLPQTLKWKDVIDSEGLLAVDLGALPGSTIEDCLLTRGIRAYHMKRRAEEETAIAVNDNMRCAAQIYSVEHSQIQSHIDRLKVVRTQYINGCLNLLNHRLFLCDCTLKLYSQTFSPYFSFSYPTCSFISSLYQSVGRRSM